MQNLIGKKVIIRTYSAGVHFGTLEAYDPAARSVTLKDSRRIWYWDGAATLSQLATDGTSKPQNCKFPCPVALIVLLEVIEIIPTTDKAATSIENVPVWSA